ncbi:MAG: transporter [Limisphaerales bacterium]
MKEKPMIRRPFQMITCVLGLFTATAWATAADKGQYTLFNPTPRELMRPMSTDRPDITESPRTVDAGHFQIEADLVSYSYDRYNTTFGGERTEGFSVATANLKIGLCNNTDLQLVVPTYNWERVKDRSTGAVERNSGFGDLITRLKINIWGNDEGSTAFGVMPFVKFPTAQDGLGNNAYEGGVTLPFAAELPGGWDLGLMAEVGIIRDEAGSGYHPEFLNTIALGRDLIGNLGGYVEFFSIVSTESGSDWVGGIGTGLTYAINDDLQLDAGVNIGLTRTANDFNPFVGVSWRF